MILKLKHTRAFSLVEIVISLAIVATGMIAIIGLIPLGLKASKDASAHTVTAVILEDAHSRLRGKVLEATKTAPFEFYYDDQGLFIEGTEQADLFARNYLAQVRVIDLQAQQKPADTTGLKAVRIELYTPIDSDGKPMGKPRDDTVSPDGDPSLPSPKTSVTYYLTTLTGPDWEDIDSSYKPKIEY